MKPQLQRGNMNKEAVYHRSDSNYCFAEAPDRVVLRLRLARGEKVRAAVEYNTKYLFAEQRFVCPMIKKYTDALYDYYTAELILSDPRLAYVFALDDEGKRYIYCEDGIVENYDYALGYYNFFQLAYISTADVRSEVLWMKNAVFYQIFVDRFFCGDVDKDLSYVNMRWKDKPTPKSFAGGDLKGIEAKLDYIASLGVNALYLTPVFVSESNHKYDISDYYNVDKHFGGNDALRSLIDSAHRRGIKVVLDAVFNHCSDKLAQFDDVRKNGRQSRYYDWFVIDGDKPVKTPLNYECFASCAYMPKFNTACGEVRRFLTDVGVYWIKAYDADGWRLDVSDEVSRSFWREFRAAVKSVKSDAVLIGENWHDSHAYLEGDQLDGVMNYAFTKTMLDAFKAEKTAAQTADRLNSLLVRYSDSSNRMMYNLLDSHDTHRFYTETGSRQKVLAALAAEAFYPGAMGIYYGTEILTEGGYDPDSRRSFDWDKAQTTEIAAFTDEVRKLIRFKRQDGGGSAAVRAEKDVLYVERENFTLAVNFGSRAEIKGKPIFTSNCGGGFMNEYGFAVFDNKEA